VEADNKSMAASHLRATAPEFTPEPNQYVSLVFENASRLLTPTAGRQDGSSPQLRRRTARYRMANPKPDIHRYRPNPFLLSEIRPDVKTPRRLYQHDP
jgi:hypothetical protein